MAQKILASPAVSAFCESMAMMLSAGIGPDEAAGLLCEDSAQNLFHDAAANVQEKLLAGGTLAGAMSESGFFPGYACRMVAAGEKAGRTEEVLHSLSAYYDTQNRLEGKLKSAVVYPTVLLLLMTVILAALLAKVLPVFTGVYQSLAGDLAVSSYGYISTAYTVGWVVLALTAVLALFLLAGGILARSPRGRAKLSVLFEKLPATSSVSAQIALAKFTSVLSIFIASGMDADASMEAASQLVTHKGLSAKVAACRKQMRGGAGLATAIYSQKMFEPIYGRMLVTGARSGKMEPVLTRLARIFSDDADSRIDRLADSIEPILSGFLTVAVGVTLISVMLPLIGILGSVG